MRTYTIFSYAILLATALHFTGGDTNIGSQIRQISFWVGLVSSTGICMLYALWISYCKACLMGAMQHSDANRNSRWRRARYLAAALIPSLLLHLCVLLSISMLMEQPLETFIRYLLNIPIVLVIALFYALSLLHSDSYLLRPTTVNEEQAARALPCLERQGDAGSVPTSDAQRTGLTPEKEETDRACFDNDSYPQTLYYILAKNGGITLQMQDMSVRFFDIVLLYCTSKARFVILRDGEMLRADSLMLELRKIGVHPWMLKISANYYVNMLLVQYPSVVHRRSIQLQPDVIGSMQPKYSEASLRKALRIGRGMNTSLIPDFLASVKALDHKGWDAFIPLD